MQFWKKKVKGLLKSELVKREITHSDLVELLAKIDVIETKSSIDCKISRGTFSASFFIQCLTVIGCEKIEIEEYTSKLFLNSEIKEEK